jgi:hypothetical protein
LYEIFKSYVAPFNNRLTTRGRRACRTNKVTINKVVVVNRVVAVNKVAAKAAKEIGKVAAARAAKEISKVVAARAAKEISKVVAAKAAVANKATAAVVNPFAEFRSGGGFGRTHL